MSLKEKTSGGVKHGLRVMLVSMLAGANMATILLMCATCLSTYLSPELHPRLSLAGLLFPVFLGANIMFVFVWLLLSLRWLLLPLLGIVLCWGYVKEYCPINIAMDDVPKENFSVLSYNVANFIADSSKGMDPQKTLDYIMGSNADVICLQECPHHGQYYTTLSKSLKKQGYAEKKCLGKSIFSKYPFIGKEACRSTDEGHNGFFAWRININGDTVFVLNSHLCSNAITEEEKRNYSQALGSYDKEKMEDSGRVLLSRLSIAASKRARQIEELKTVIKDNSAEMLVLAGDLNDTPISYTCQQLSLDLKSAFVESGSGLGVSFVRKAFPVRIDHIFVSKNLYTYSTYVDNSISSSDHHPILTHVSKCLK